MSCLPRIKKEHLALLCSQHLAVVLITISTRQLYDHNGGDSNSGPV